MKKAFALVAALAFMGSTAFAGEYTDKSYHGDTTHEYKHPHHKSYTGPFDYGSRRSEAPAAAPRIETGKCNCFSFDGTRSNDPDGQKLSYLWEFGDGTTSDQAVVQHCYDKAGDYTVTLTVKDSSGMVCDTGVTTTKVSANFPPTASVSDAKACVGEGVTLNASGSTGSGPLTYAWDFGDGSTGEGAQASHTYEKAGNYRVRVVVNDGKNTSCSTAAASAVVTIGDRPTVNLTGPESICLGRTASFDANAVGVSKLTWDFGDGETTTGGSRASHTYTKPGNYTVTVTGDNGQGMPCSVATSRTTVKVFGTPIADAGENLACCLGKEFKYDGSKSSAADGGSLTYHWDFGDGGTSDTATGTYTYQKTGNYRVVLTVKDASGSDCGSATSSFVAVVNAAPEAVISVK